MSHQNSDSYDRLIDVEQQDFKENIENNSKSKTISLWSKLKTLKIQWFMPILIKVIGYSVIFGICSGTWNYFMYNYSILFDSDLIGMFSILK